MEGSAGSTRPLVTSSENDFKNVPSISGGNPLSSGLKIRKTFENEVGERSKDDSYEGEGEVQLLTSQLSIGRLASFKLSSYISLMETFTYNEKYEKCFQLTIYDQNRSRIFVGKEEQLIVPFYLAPFKSFMRFTFNLFDPDGNLVIYIKGKLGGCCAKTRFDIYLVNERIDSECKRNEGEIVIIRDSMFIGTIYEKFGNLKCPCCAKSSNKDNVCYTVCNMEEKPVMEIFSSEKLQEMKKEEGKLQRGFFDVYVKDGTPVARIGMMKVVKEDSQVTHFVPDSALGISYLDDELEVIMRTLILGAAILIDYQLYRGKFQQVDKADKTNFDES